jgi:hypothetical protein
VKRVLEGQDGAEPVHAHKPHMGHRPGGQRREHVGEEIAEPDAAPVHIANAPTGDAMEVGDHVPMGHGRKIYKGHIKAVGDRAAHLDRGDGIGVRDRTSEVRAVAGEHPEEPLPRRQRPRRRRHPWPEVSHPWAGSVHGLLHRGHATGASSCQVRPSCRRRGG